MTVGDSVVVDNCPGCVPKVACVCWAMQLLSVLVRRRTLTCIQAGGGGVGWSPRVSRACVAMLAGRCRYSLHVPVTL